jgi:hypothetical protein
MQKSKVVPKHRGMHISDVFSEESHHQLARMYIECMHSSSSMQFQHARTHAFID